MSIIKNVWGVGLCLGLGVGLCAYSMFGCRTDAHQTSYKVSVAPSRDVHLTSPSPHRSLHDKTKHGALSPSRTRKPAPRLVSLPKRSCTLPLKQVNWFDKAALAADRTVLREQFRKMRYRLPHRRRTYILVTRVVEGVGQPAYQHFSLDDSGFVYSQRKYWPASTVKVWAAVGALLTLREFGLTGSSRLIFRDRLGRFRGTAADLYKKIVNHKYDRLMRIAGATRFHDKTRRKRYGMPHMVLMRAYSPLRTFRRSPKIKYSDHGKKGVIPARKCKIEFPRCRSNCVTFFELQEVLRRLVLHDELPKAERFPIVKKDVEGLKKMLLRTPNKIGRAARKLWGRGVLSYNKSGSARGLDQLENVFLVAGKKRYIVTLSIPWYRSDASASPSLRKLNRLGYKTLKAIEALSTDRVSVQPDAGLPIRLQISPQNSNISVFRVEVLARGISQLRGWLGQTPVTFEKKAPGLFVGHLKPLQAHRQLLVLRGHNSRGRAVAYRSVAVTFPKERSELACLRKLAMPDHSDR